MRIFRLGMSEAGLLRSLWGKAREGWELLLRARGGREPMVVVRRRAAPGLVWVEIGLVDWTGWLSFLGTVLAERPMRTTERVELAFVDVDVIIAFLLVSSPLFTVGRMIVWPWPWVDIFGIRDRVVIVVVGPAEPALKFLLGLLT